jgi:hypothetical protein
MSLFLYVKNLTRSVSTAYSIEEIVVAETGIMVLNTKKLKYH